MRYVKDVVTLEVDREKCLGCGMCLAVCPHGVFELAGQKVQLTDRDACMECGACALNCPVGALAVQAGVGCALALLYQMIGRGNQTCC